MPLVKRIIHAFLFPNGQLAVIDSNWQQVPELQGPYSLEKHRRILLEAMPNCELKGFDILPDGFTKAASFWAFTFIQLNKSPEELEG